MKKGSSKNYYNLRPKSRLIPGSSQKKSGTSQQIVEDYCDQCVREGNENQISCEICFTRKRWYQEYQQSTRRRNWEPRAIKHGSISITVYFTSFEYTQRKSRHNSKTNRREDRHLKWAQSFKWYIRKRGIVTRRYPTDFRTKTPEKTIPKRERRKFRPPRIRRFYPKLFNKQIQQWRKYSRIWQRNGCEYLSRTTTKNHWIATTVGPMYRSGPGNGSKLFPSRTNRHNKADIIPRIRKWEPGTMDGKIWSSFRESTY